MKSPGTMASHALPEVELSIPGMITGSKKATGDGRTASDGSRHNPKTKKGCPIIMGNRQSRVGNHAVRAGFTLLEVLLSVAIIAMLTGILAGALHVTMQTWERGEGRIERVEKIRHLLDFIAEDIRGAYSYRTKVEERLFSAFFGDKDRLNFISTSPPLTSGMVFTGLKETSYWVDPATGLMLREAPLLHSDLFDEERGVTLVVAPDIRAIQLEYLYQERSRLTGSIESEWSESWGALDELSEATGVRASLHFMDENVRRYSIRRIPRAVRMTLRYEEVFPNGMKKSKELGPVVVPIMAGQTFQPTRPR